ncbi:hypothetical protein Cgig2_028027 [Carnegiea gigantea]|uniref:Endonuclease/exonuclease/phosphatase domain-containing protein n=1 Tax=Carnegiea gigantea TaxID=171969 RepID=A0A9Q1GKN8_9CARY|nr:hypothetical protein Cgig2_028027 [Carnegiea gigantea]
MEASSPHSPTQTGGDKTVTYEDDSSGRPKPSYAALPKAYQFQVIHKTEQLIHGRVIQMSTNKKFFITFVYGYNHEAQRRHMWEALVEISHTMDDPWCVLGDFNSVLHQGERMGGNDADEREMRDFGECIHQCGLQEFYYVGAFFTWTNKTVWSRIDGALHKGIWFDIFDFTHVVYQANGLSDHTPIMLDFPACPRPKKNFMFCDMWIKDAHFKEMVKSHMDRRGQGSALKVLQQLLHSLKKALRELNKHKFADIYAQQIKARTELVQI